MSQRIDYRTLAQIKTHHPNISQGVVREPLKSLLTVFLGVGALFIVDNPFIVFFGLAPLSIFPLLL